ncbi:hypothetical protein BD410DRAFT_893088 [Rickenella mellea]|uniref:Transcription initiation factor IIF subunit alpha n=1 Tax=Rickenella mellea TaxID=50990 RepID=A0A4R5XGF1_9AGAM|nr:hypothetical protein BD410DRAFT_893088 [Rickenella mellea]
MAPKTHDINLLFHPKKKKAPPLVKKESSESTSTPPADRKPRPAGATRPSPKPKLEPDEDVKPSPLPEGDYQEFKLMSTDRKGWRYDIMKFDTRKAVDINGWEKPVKLNRKELKREGSGVETPPQAVGPMLGLDGKPVIGADGRLVMVDADGRPILAQNGMMTPSQMAAKAKEEKNAKKKKFQKKTKQVFPVADEVRQMRKEERYPWVFEDGRQSEVWVGMMEEAAKSTTHALFMPASGEVFKFVPCHRWYKFQKKPTHIIPTLEEAEKLMAQMQKNKDPERWLLHKRNGQGPSAATSAIFKAEFEGRTVAGGSSLVYASHQSLGPGGRRLKTVDSGMRGLFDEDDEEGVDTKRKREKEFGGEGDMDEMEYESDFADDDDKMEPEGMNDDEAKELEACNFHERLKREYKSANKARDDGAVDDEDEEDDNDHLTNAGKAVKKLVQKREQGGVSDSDEEKNPYVSEGEEEDDDEPPPPPTPPTQPEEPPATTVPPTPPKPANRAFQGGGKGTSSKPGSRSASPAPAAAPNLGGIGHSVVAKRATSPKAPKLKTNGASGSRATSPLAPSRASSPPAPSTPSGTPSSRATSPHAGSASVHRPSAKRKATDDASTSNAPSPAPSGAQQPKMKKRKAVPSGVPTAPPGELRDEMVIEWLRNTPNASTRDCIQYFQPCLTDDEKKARFTALVKEVAVLKGGVLTLKASYRDGSVGAASPSPA